MGDCNRCERERHARFECPACHERFCERHRAPGAHDCPALRPGEGGDAVEPVEEPVEPTDLTTDVASPTAEGVNTGPSVERSTGDSPVDESSAGDEPLDAASPPTRLYAGDVDDPTDLDGDDSDGGEILPGMDFDPTAKTDRFLRAAGVFAAVLLVGFLAAGVLWVGPGGNVFGLFGDAGSAAAPPPEELNVTQVERLIHEQLTRERRDAGIEPLAYDDELAVIGEYHSRDMGTNDYTSHTSPSGETIADRYRQFGYTCEAIGEAVQWIEYDEVDWGADPEARLARTVVENWMRSDLHRSFVLNGSWSRHGVGVHVTGAGQVYVTQNTCGGR